MNRHVEFDGYIQSAVSPQVVAATRYVVYCEGTGVHVVLAIIVSSTGIHAVRHSIPLCRVTCGLEATWQVAADGQSHRRVTTNHITHTAAKTHSISRDYAFVVAQVGQGDVVVICFALGEMECPQINPGASTHLLIDAELALDASVLDGIDSVRYAARHGLVGDIDGIIVLDEHFRNPKHLACHTLVLCRLYHAISSFFEGILAILVAFLVVSEAHATVLPMEVRDAFLVSAAVPDVIVIDYDFLLLPVSLSWSEDDGSGILQHWDEVGHYEGLREHIFCRTEKPWTLPYPFLLVEVEVLAVTVTNAEVSALQAFLNVIWAAERRHPRVAPIEFLLIDASRISPVHHACRDELLDGRVLCEDADVVSVVGHRQESLDFHV